MTKIKLFKAHEHAGIMHAAGDVINVSAADAAYIVANNIGATLAAKKAKGDKAKTEQAEHAEKDTQSEVKDNE